MNEIKDQIATELIRFASEHRNEPDFGKRVELVDIYTVRIAEIVAPADKS